MTKTRKRVWRNLLTVGGLLAALGFGGAALTTAEGAGGFPTSPWSRMAREQTRAERLEAQLQETLRRMVARDEVVEALRAGRLTLLEATARFRALDAGCADPRRAILTLTARKLDPEGRGPSYDECVCRNVIEHIRRGKEIQSADDSGGDVDDIIARLEEEYQRLVQIGALRLPQ
jgi:hypothetical protein